MTSFSIAYDATFSRKVAHFAAAGPHKLHFVFDFDRTLTVARLRVYDPRSDEDPAQVRQKNFYAVRRNA